MTLSPIDFPFGYCLVWNNPNQCPKLMSFVNFLYKMWVLKVANMIRALVLWRRSALTLKSSSQKLKPLKVQIFYQSVKTSQKGLISCWTFYFTSLHAPRMLFFFLLSFWQHSYKNIWLSRVHLQSSGQELLIWLSD